MTQIETVPARTSPILISSETNTQLCECGANHDYAVIGLNIVWYCKQFDGYYVREPESDNEI